jgi:hypothetical protein
MSSGRWILGDDFSAMGLDRLDAVSGVHTRTSEHDGNGFRPEDLRCGGEQGIRRRPEVPDAGAIDIAERSAMADREVLVRPGEINRPRLHCLSAGRIDERQFSATSQKLRQL